MTYRVVPGDIAIINRSLRVGLIGRVVEVMHQVRPTVIDGQMVYVIDECPFPAYVQDGAMWRVRTLGRPFVLMSRSGKATSGLEWPCRDSWLAPLREVAGIDQVLLKAGPAPISTRMQRRS